MALNMGLITWTTDFGWCEAFRHFRIIYWNFWNHSLGVDVKKLVIRVIPERRKRAMISQLFEQIETIWNMKKVSASLVMVDKCSAHRNTRKHLNFTEKELICAAGENGAQLIPPF